MSDPKIIYLGPACQKEGDGREWCEDDVWTQCECGCSSARYVLESDAQSELAALREELAGANRRLGACINQIEEQQQRLAAAEQRNASLSNAMRRAIEWFDDGVGRSHEEFSMIQDMRASLAQPTESGASE